MRAVEHMRGYARTGARTNADTRAGKKDPRARVPQTRISTLCIHANVFRPVMSISHVPETDSRFTYHVLEYCYERSASH